MYADFESVLEKMSQKKGESTDLFQKYTPIAWCFQTICVEPKHNMHKVYVGENAVNMLLISPQEEANRIIDCPL